MQAWLMWKSMNKWIIKPNFASVHPPFSISASVPGKIRCECMWHVAMGGRFERTFCDIRVFNSYTPSNCSQSLGATCRKHEQEKRIRQYEERIREIERASFSPFVFASSGGMSPGASIFFKCQADLISNKRVQEYSITMNWIRTIISFALLRSAIMCLRGNRSWENRRPLVPDCHVELVVRESRIGTSTC